MTESVADGGEAILARDRETREDDAALDKLSWESRGCVREPLGDTVWEVLCDSASRDRLPLRTV